MGITVKTLEQQILEVEGVCVVIRVPEKTEVIGLNNYGKQLKRLGNKVKVKELVERIRVLLGDDGIGVVVLDPKLKRVDVRAHMDKARV